MTRTRRLFCCLLLAACTPVALARAADIDVRTSVSQTALWVGVPVSYRVELACADGVDVLQEDLGPDRLLLTGLQVIGHQVERAVEANGRIRYVVTYQLTTYDPGPAETVTVADWKVRYSAGTPAAGGPSAVREVTVPGVPLGWRSALPGDLKTLDARLTRAATPMPRWWQPVREAGWVAIALGVLAAAGAVIARTGVRRPTVRRRSSRGPVRQLQAALEALRSGHHDGEAERRAAYDALARAVRQCAADLTGLPARALTPAEVEARWPASVPGVPAGDVARVLAACEAAQYQPPDRLPDARALAAALDDAAQAFTGAR